MNSIEELIKNYEKRKASLEIWITSAVIDERQTQITNALIECFSTFIEDLKNLPNELRAVNRNEQLKEFERYKCNHCGRIFKKKCVHNCNTGLRKRHQSYSIITLSEND